MKKIILATLLTVFLLLFLQTYFFPKKYPHQVSIAAIFHDEERFLEEWIEYHKAIGVDHFYLFNHLSSDNFHKVLKPYIDGGLVELYDWPYPHTTGKEADWTRIQSAAYRQALDLARDKTQWLAILDTDEFLVPKKASDIKEFLRDYEGAGGVMINWQVFGTSHVEKVPDDRWMIQTLFLKTPVQYEVNTYCKSIVRPEKVKTCHDPHNMVYYPWAYPVDVDGNIFNWKFHKSSRVLTDKIQINHYWARDNEFFVKEKLNRYQQWGVNTEGCIKRNQEANQIEDRSILKFLPLMPKRKEYEFRNDSFSYIFNINWAINTC